jgi:hypothetical protein
MRRDRLNHIPLNSAYLCLDCDAVGNSSMRCPACASEVLIGLAGVFGRREDVVESNLLRFPHWRPGPAVVGAEPSVAIATKRIC